MAAVILWMEDTGMIINQRLVSESLERLREAGFNLQDLPGEFDKLDKQVGDGPLHLDAGVQQMRYRRHEVVLFQVMHHDELDFRFDGMTKFIGLEIPDELLAQPEQIRRAYLRAVERFNQRLDDVCQRNRVERVLVDTSRDMGAVLVDYLNQRSRLRRGR